MEKFETFEVGKTYVFYSGNGLVRFRGLIVKRTKKTITVRFSDTGNHYLHRCMYGDAADVVPTTLRIVDRYANCEYAVTRSAGRRKNCSVTAIADHLAIEQM